MQLAHSPSVGVWGQRCSETPQRERAEEDPRGTGRVKPAWGPQPCLATQEGVSRLPPASPPTLRVPGCQPSAD